MEYYQTLGFKIFIIGYFVLGIITAILTIKKGKGNNINIWSWAFFGYLFPIIPYLILKNKLSKLP